MWLRAAPSEGMWGAAMANFRQALGIAQRQNAKALELRAAVSLCRLLHTRGMPEDGLLALTSVYRWFNEGSATADLMEAKELVTRERAKISPLSGGSGGRR